MFADEIRRAIAAASRITLPQVTALLWRAYGDGQVTEAEAEALSGLIEARLLSRTAPNPGQNRTQTGASVPGPLRGTVGLPRKPGVGSKPRTDASLERRRRWAASGRLPPTLAARFTLAEQAVLALVAAETARRGDCRLAVGHVAAIAGVSETTVRNAIREARKLDLLTVEERPVTGFRNLPNVVRIVSAEWTAWLRLARKGIPAWRQHSPAEGGGCKSPNRTHTQVLALINSGTTGPKKSCRRAAGDLDRSAPTRIRAGGRTGRAMR